MHLSLFLMNSMCARKIGLTSPSEFMGSGICGYELERMNHFLYAQAKLGICWSNVVNNMTVKFGFLKAHVLELVKVVLEGECRESIFLLCNDLRLYHWPDKEFGINFRITSTMIDGFSF